MGRKKRQMLEDIEEEFSDDEAAALVNQYDAEEEEEEDLEEDEEEEEQPGPLHRGGPDRAPIYNIEALHEKYEDVGWAADAEWIDTLAVTASEPTVVSNIDDDIERELAFYNQALGSAKEAIMKYQGMGVPWLRPTDYYAEMVKTDDHMAKVKDKLMYEQQQIEQAIERRKAREQKAYAKQMSLEKQRERNREKKNQIEQITRLRKHRQKSGFAGELDLDRAIDDMNGRPGGGGKFKDRFQGDERYKNKKRTARDSKYGFGGRKRLGKQNDAVSAAADPEKFHPKNKLGIKQGGVNKHKGGKHSQKRLGKARRQSMKRGKAN